MIGGKLVHCRMAAGLLVAVATSFALAAPALAHVERPSYFPNPDPDTSATPAAGGEVPKVRTLYSALLTDRPGQTRVVCKEDSLRLLKRSVADARENGYFIRPSDRRSLSAADADALVRINTKLFSMCRYSSIQPAVDDSGNNDRVVIMPGLYTEPKSRAKPTGDPRCDRYRTNGDRPGDEGTAMAYAYQYYCPNDQNLIAVIGRKPGPGQDPVPPRENRQGIPNLGKCIRCNFQMEGSGVSADDVVIEAGDASKGNGGPNGAGAAKDVAVRADRADGFVLRNVTVRHAGEHGIYVIETDGYVLDRFKTFYNRLYGTLVFTSDHGSQRNCEAAGHGDSGIYPGGAPETGEQRPPGTAARLNQEVTRCDLRHNLAGYSGTNGNAIYVHDNRIYDNSLGFTTDVVTGAGHPGYPGDSALIEKNEIFSNNFNSYAPDSDVVPSFPFPVGTGLWIAGGNRHTVRQNWFYDNWRRGTMLFSVPDALVCGPAAGGNEQLGCDSTTISTSYYNQTYDNRMGVRPDKTPDPNGLDFWWDQFPGSRGNCWYRNTGPRPITSDPPAPLLPDCRDGRDQALSIGTGNPKNEAELVRCTVAFETRDFSSGSPCEWLTPPSEPSGDGAATPVPLPVAPAFTPLPAVGRAARTRERTRTPRRGEVPLSLAACVDWNRASPAGKATLIARVQAFAGGVVNDGSRNLGTGAVLSTDDAAALYNAWCARPYARGFLLYKLYTWSAAFARRLG